MGRPGSGAKLGLRPKPVKTAGKYALWIGLTKAVDYGIVQFSLDGNKIGQPVDCYSPNVTKEELSLGEYDLAAGDHTIEVQIVGANPKAKCICSVRILSSGGRLNDLARSWECCLCAAGNRGNHCFCEAVAHG